MARLAADAEARHVEITAQKAVLALIRSANAAERGTALARSLTDHTHVTGSAAVTGIVATQSILRARPGWHAARAVDLRVAAVPARVFNERVAAHAYAALGSAGKRVAFERRQEQVIGHATVIDGHRLVISWLNATSARDA